MFIKKKVVNRLINEIVGSFLKFAYGDDIPEAMCLLRDRLVEGINAMETDQFHNRTCDQCFYQQQCVVYVTANTEWNSCPWVIGRVCPNYNERV